MKNLLLGMTLMITAIGCDRIPEGVADKVYEKTGIILNTAIAKKCSVDQARVFQSKFAQNDETSKLEEFLKENNITEVVFEDKEIQEVSCDAALLESADSVNQKNNLIVCDPSTYNSDKGELSQNKITVDANKITIVSEYITEKVNLFTYEVLGLNDQEMEFLSSGITKEIDGIAFNSFAEIEKRQLLYGIDSKEDTKIEQALCGQTLSFEEIKAAVNKAIKQRDEEK